MNLPVAHIGDVPRDWTRYLPLAEAARLLGINPESLRDRCVRELQGSGLAIFERPATGGRRQWFISKGFDPRLLGETWAQRYQDSDLSAYSERQRRDAFIRRECVLITRRVREDADHQQDVVDRAIAECHAKFPGFKVSRTRLYAWQQAYRYPADLHKLIDRRGGARSTKGSAEAWEELRGLYLCDKRPALRDCWLAVKRLAEERGWSWLSYTRCAAALNTHIPVQDQVRAREPETYRTQLAPYIEQAPESWRAGELWISDHKQLDCVVRFRDSLIRPWLTAWMDWRTRKIVGWTLSDSPNSTTIVAALRAGLLDPANCGGPSHVWIDNGKDFDSWMLHGQTKKQRRAKLDCKVDEATYGGILQGLGIEAHFAQPYNANGKARLERWFRTLESFSKRFATYTGIDIESKPERLNEILKLGRNVPSFEEVYQRLADFITGANEDSDHTIVDLQDEGELLAPAEAFRRWCDRRRVFNDPSALDLLLQAWHRPVPVLRNGIRLAFRGRSFSYGQFSHELAPFKATRKADRVLVRVAYDPHQLETIKVFTLDWKFIATVSMNRLGGAHGTKLAMEHVSESVRRQKSYEKALRTVEGHGIAGILTNEEHVAKIAAEDRQKQVAQAAPAASMQIVRTSLDGQSKAVEMSEFRQAAGSDHQSFPSVSPMRPAQLLQHVKARQQEPAFDGGSEDPFERLRRKHGTR